MLRANNKIRMTNWKLIGILILAMSLLQSVSAIGRTKTFKYELAGTIDHNTQSDTLIIDYNIRPLGFEPDSMIIEVSPDVYLLGENAKDSANHACIFGCYTGDSIVVDENGVTGSIAFLHGGQTRTYWSCSVIAYYTNDSGQTKGVRRYVSLSSGQSEFGMEIMIPSGGLYKTRNGSPIAKEGVFVGWGMSVGYTARSFGLSLSTSWSGFGKNFAFSEPFRTGFRYYLPASGDFRLRLTGGIKSGRTKLASGDSEYFRRGWGVDYGIGIEGPFERLSYSYSLTPERYHTLELYLVSAVYDRSKLGTRFVLQRSENIWMFRLGLHFEGFDIEGEGNVESSLARYNPRPFPHKILAWAGAIPGTIIAAPLYLGSKFVELFKKKKSTSTISESSSR